MKNIFLITDFASEVSCMEKDKGGDSSLIASLAGEVLSPFVFIFNVLA